MNLPAKSRARDGTPREAVAPVGSDFALGEAHVAAPAASGGRSIMAAIVQFGLVVGLLVAASMVYSAIVATAPVAERSARERVARLVDTATVEAALTGPMIAAWGEVQAAQTLIVRPEIAGRLEWLHPDVAAGGLLRAGDVVARFDDRDLKLAVLQAKADIADIEARIQIERGQAAVGERELSRLSREITEAQKSLVRREPQMAQLEAELAAARAVLEQAENALGRTRVVVPFDALVIEENVAPGTMLSAGMEAGTLVASGRFNVVLRVPATALDWLALDGSQRVVLAQPGVWPKGATREGRVVRLGAGLSATGRMAEIIVEVEDPLALSPEHQGAPKLLLGSFLEGRMEGRAVEGGAVLLDRAHLRDGDTVWVMAPEDRLEIRQVEIVWRGGDNVLVTGGLAAGERVVVTTLATFAEGMALRTRDGDGS